uniref:Succinate dehydrogenase assembly factor 3 n=1 Tax=Craspedostauros australis TaxID=1486917 RepID=A0A6T6F0B5_9STRA|mmetsp:Transcript_17245/g.47767  ORF Transcript_17245/g.47767 Transcript_17245/m.47767 type:complete len:129 (+) Transcript_17245:1124-1510(+)
MTPPATAANTAAIHLYRSIRKSHRKFMPPKLQKLGDRYVRSEFKQHKSVTQPHQLDQFMAAWQEYLLQIQSTARKQHSIQSGMLDEPSALLNEKAQRVSFGKHLPSSFDLSDEQHEQLERLKDEASKV